MTLSAKDLLIDRFFVAYLRLSFSELDVGRLHVRKLRLVELFAVLELLLKDGQIGTSLLQGRDVLLGDLRTNFGAHDGALRVGLLDWRQVLVAQFVLLLAASDLRGKTHVWRTILVV